MCSRRAGGALIVLLSAIALVGGSIPMAAQAAGTVTEWKVNPYRNFIGDWSGKFVKNPGGVADDVSVTITEDKPHARMQWDYTFGHPGERYYGHATKWFLFSQLDSRMRMHFDGEFEWLFDTPDLAKFMQTGMGTLTAVEHFERRNYWHVKVDHMLRMTMTLQGETLSYVWETIEGKKTKLYSEVALKRVVGPSIKP